MVKKLAFQNPISRSPTPHHDLNTQDSRPNNQDAQQHPKSWTRPIIEYLQKGTIQNKTKAIDHSEQGSHYLS